MGVITSTWKTPSWENTWEDHLGSLKKKKKIPGQLNQILWSGAQAPTFFLKLLT